MKYLFYIVFLLAAIVFQLVAGDLIAIRGVVPDLTLIVVCSISLLEGRARGTVWGWVVGLIEDLLGSGLIGALAFSRAIVAFLAATVLHFRSVQNIVSAALVVGILSLLNNTFIFIFHLPGGANLMMGILMQIFFPSLYTIVFAVLMFAIIPESIWEKIYKTESIPFG